MTSSQFQILRASSPSELSLLVTSALASGWTLVGHACHHGGGIVEAVWWQTLVLAQQKEPFFTEEDKTNAITMLNRASRGLPQRTDEYDLLIKLKQYLRS